MKIKVIVLSQKLHILYSTVSYVIHRTKSGADAILLKFDRKCIKKTVQFEKCSFFVYVDLYSIAIYVLSLFTYLFIVR